MAGFNYGIFRKQVEDSVVAQAERRKRQTESLWLGRLHDAVDYIQAIGARLMTYRTWNYAASVVGVLFYNAKILGIGTDGFHFETRTKPGSRVRQYYGAKWIKYNPVYGYTFNHQGNKPWKGARGQGYSLRTGRDFANYAAEEAKRKLKKRVGYEIFIAVAMPYASYRRGNMNYRTISLIDDAVRLYLGKGKSQIATIGIETSN